MNADFDKLRDIFLAAVEQAPAARDAYLDQACAGDAALRGEVAVMLQAHVAQEGPLDRGVLHGDQTNAYEANRHGPGTMIGPYKLLQQIGEGGMGTVFMAEQTEPVKRRVALKIIKAGMDSKQIIARFEAERQALAMMDHVNIARVFDGGTTGPNPKSETRNPKQIQSTKSKAQNEEGQEVSNIGASDFGFVSNFGFRDSDFGQGRPYFVMELVHGVPITKYCDDNHLTPRERLELFVPVCQAIQHAHQKGIIHRDIKPSNVMVTLYDGKPVPKVIDFGVAKATEQKLTERTLFTQYGTMVGTLEYMSPEQAEMSALGVDTRSDIYSLGVLLYELLTGSTPLTHKRMKEAAYAEILRMIKEEEPPKPSTRLSDSGEALASISANRHTEPAKLTKLVRGELDWIVMKCLEKDRNRRYETANGFAADVQRYLADEPVQACPPSVGYRFRKFARRNKRMLVTATLLGAMLLVLAGSFGWMTRDRATQRFRNAEAIAALLDQCEDALRDDRADRAALALEAAERRAADGGADDLAGRLARCRADLRLLRELDAIDTFRWTWAQDRSPDPAVVAARWRPALAAYGVTPDADPFTDAAKRVNESLIRDRVLTALDLWLAFAERSAWVRTVLRSTDPNPYRDAVRDAFAARDDRALSALAGRPEALAQPARFAAVLGQLRERVTPERRRAVLESALRARPGDLALLVELGNSYPSLGLPGQSYSREEIGERLRWFQAAVAAHPENVGARNNLGNALQDRGDLDGAIACYEEALRLDPAFTRGHFNIGIVLRDKGQLDAAIAACRKSLDLPSAYAPAHSQLGYLLMRKGDREGAKAAFNAAIRLDPKDPEPHYQLGFALHEKGDTEGAIEAYRKAIEVDRTHSAAHNNLGCILCDMKQDYDGAIVAFKVAIRLAPTEALNHRNLGNALLGKWELDGAIAAYKEAIRLDPKHAPAHNGLGNALREKGNTDGAIKAFRDASWADPDYFDAHFNLGQALLAIKHDLDGAITHFTEAVRLRPNVAESHCNLGVARALKQDFDGAVKAYRAAKQHAPKIPDIYSNLALALSGLKDYDGAVKELRALLEINPRDARAHNSLGVAMKHKGDVNGALTAFRDAIEISQNYSHPHTNLAWLLATGPDRVRDGKAAVRHATRACEMTVWKDADSISTLAAAHAEAGDFDKAVEYQRKAFTLPEFEKAFGKGGWERLRLYERKMPYRDPALTPMKD